MKQNANLERELTSTDSCPQTVSEDGHSYAISDFGICLCYHACEIHVCTTHYNTDQSVIPYAYL